MQLKFKREVERSVDPRPGVVETLAQLQREGSQVAFVTTVTPERVLALASALTPAVALDRFSLLVDSSDVAPGAPATARYELALSELGERPEECVAVVSEESPVDVIRSLGIASVGFPIGAVTEIPGVARVVDRLTIGDLRGVLRTWGTGRQTRRGAAPSGTRPDLSAPPAQPG